MIAVFRPALVMLAAFTALLGIAVPVLFTGFAQAVLPFQAGGSLIVRDGKVIGAANVGQAFEQARYFHARPSATSEPDPENVGKMRDRPFNAAASSGSNLGPTSAALLEAVKARIGAFPSGGPVPADAATASGSGLDPHISPANALRQVVRVAEARGLPEARVRALVEQHVEARTLGLLGEPRVNVLRLNLALDAIN
jgi:K+-transporting ATPase ATPase C chain